MQGSPVTPAEAARAPVSPPSPGGKLQAILLIVAAWLALGALPLVPAPVLPGLDPGWVMGLNKAHSQGLVHGRDIVWTYGPLGYLAYPDASGHSPYRSLVFRLGIYLLWCVALLRLPFAVRDRRVAAWLVLLIGLAAILDPLIDDLGLAFFTWALLVIVDRSRWRTAALGVLAFLSALGCMVKANSGVEAACLFGAAALAALWDDGFSKRGAVRIAGAALLFLIFAVLLYGMETGTLRMFPDYIRNSLDMASAYSEEMSYNGPWGQALIAVSGIAILFLLLPLAERPLRNIAPAFLPVLVYAFFSFKSCMVRQDAHAADFELRLALAALFFIVLARTKSFLYLTLCFQIACIVISHHYISEGWPNTDTVVASRLTLSGNWPALNAYTHWSKSWNGWERESRENLSVLRVDPEIASAVGSRSIEVLPWEVGRVQANGWTWNPRPIFQSYAAYTPKLDHINGEYLRGKRSPDFTLLSWDDIDGRHPFLDGPFSWQIQLDRYQTITTGSDLLLLGRRQSPRFQRVETISNETTAWNRENRVPLSADPIVVKARIGRSLLGRLRSFLFRSNPLFIELTRQSGRTERYRAPRANLADGLIINEFPQTLADLAVLASFGCTLSDPVISFRFKTDSPSEFGETIELEWTRLVSVPEPAGNCVQITQTSATAPIWGGVRSVSVAAGAGTKWSVTPNEPWVTLSSEAPFSGDAAIDVSILRNSGPDSRTGMVSIGGRNFKITQLGPQSIRAGRSFIQFGYFGAAPSGILFPRTANLELIIDQFAGFSGPQGQPVIGDWTGNGKMRIGIFHDGRWYLDLNGNGRWDGKEGGDGIFTFGLPGDTAVPGDWAGDGKTRLAVFRHGEWAFDMNGNLAFDRTDKFVQFGLAGDVPVVGKWSHDRTDRVGVYRDGTWIVDSNGNEAFDSTDEQFSFGLPGDKPLVSLINGKIGVYRNGTCFLGVAATRVYDPKTTLKLTCGSPKPLLAAW